MPATYRRLWACADRCGQADCPWAIEVDPGGGVFLNYSVEGDPATRHRIVPGDYSGWTRDELHAELLSDGVPGDVIAVFLSAAGK